MHLRFQQILASHHYAVLMHESVHQQKQGVTNRMPLALQLASEDKSHAQMRAHKVMRDALPKR